MSARVLAQTNQERAKARGWPAPVPLDMGIATLYLRGGFGYHATYVRELTLREMNYAQYGRALRVEWTEKGKRKSKAIVLTYDPGLVVLGGHEHPSTPDPSTAPEEVAGGLVVQQSRRTCFDPAWETEFDAWIASYLEQHPSALVGDYRGFDTKESR